MKKGLRRLISCLLVLALLAGVMSEAVFASAGAAETQNVREENRNVSAAGTDSFSQMLAEDISEKMNGQGDPSTESYVTGLEMNGTAAAIELNLNEDCCLTVDIWSEDETTVLATGTTAVRAGQTSATVETAPTEGEFPDYYVVKAYLWNDAGRVSGDYESVYYTKDIQDLLASSVEDYDQELVINFDESADNNFGVLSEDVIRIEPAAGVNTVVSEDPQTHICVIENIDGQIASLKKGDTIAYEYAPGSYLLIKIKSISVKGTTATIVEETDLEMNEIFTQLKIHSQSRSEDAEFDENSDLEEGFTYTGKQAESSPKRYNGTGSKTYSNGFSANKSWSVGGVTISISGSVGISLTAAIDYDISMTRVSLEFSLTTTVSSNLTISAKLPEKSCKLGSFSIPLCGGAVSIGVTPYVVYRASATISFDAKATAKQGFRVSGSVKGLSCSNTSTQPTSSSQITFDGEIYVGLKLTVSVSILEGAGEVSLTGTFGVQFTGKGLYVGGSCVGTLTLTLNLKWSLSVGLSVLWGLGSWNFTVVPEKTKQLWTKTFTIGSHNFSAYGGRSCAKCGTVYDCATDYSCGGKYAVGARSTVNLYSYPYEYGSPVSKLKNCFVDVSCAVTNSKGQRWYKTSSGYYAPASGLTKDLSVVDPTLNVNVGSVTYYQMQIPAENLIVSSDTVITCISASVNGTSLGTTYPYAYSVNLRNAGIMTNAKWSSLGIGSYTLKLTVSYSGGIVKTKNIPVSVEPVPVEAPSVSAADTYTGKTVTICQQEPGAVLTYTFDGHTQSTADSSVTFEITSTQTVSAYSTLNGRNSAAAKVSYSVPKLVTPTVSVDYRVDGAYVTVNADSGATVYYTFNGGAEQTYTGPFNLKESGSLSLRSIKAGCVPSDTGSGSVTLPKPSVPTLSRFQSDYDVAKESTVSVSWSYDKLAEYYLARLYSGDTCIDEQRVDGGIAAFTLPEAGEYTVTAQAINSLLGDGEESKPVSFAAMEPVTVTFADFDGTVISKQTVPYKGTAVRPTAPTRRGYTFDGWDNSYAGVKADTLVTAEYTINYYTVKFYSIDGTTLLDTQTVSFDSAADPTYAATQVELSPGYILENWRVENAAADSYLDYTHVDSDMSLVAVTRWEDLDYPVILTPVSAVWNEQGTGYRVSVKLTVADESVLEEAAKTLKIVAAVKTSEDKLIGLEIHTLNVSASTVNGTYNMFVSCDEPYLADRVDVYILGCKVRNQTGTTLAQAKSITPTLSPGGNYWSEWSTEYPTGYAENEIQSKTQYRYRDNTRATCTDTVSSKAGWTLESTELCYYNWPATSSYYETTSKPTESNTLRIIGSYTVTDAAAYTIYTYYHWYGWNDSGVLYMSYASGYWHNYEETTSTSPFKTGQVYDGHQSYTSSAISGKHGSLWWLKGTTYVPAVTHTVWKYQTRGTYNTYHFYQWIPGTWSDWGDTVYTTSVSRDAETRTVYRHIATDMTEDTSGTLRTVSGKLDAEMGDLEGTNAVVMVYKERNADPTQEQIEYVGELTVGADNAYNISFKTREEPSELTGDFIVCMALKGTSNLIDICKIAAPVPEYTVTFYAMDGVTVLDTQTVQKGGNAEVPEAPEVNGYSFAKWSGTVTNVTQDQNCVAIYQPNVYAVAYVDWVNETLSVGTARYGEELAAPVPSDCEGHTFLGWDLLLDGQTTVSGDMILTAVYETEKYSVTFLDAEGETLEEQQVEYGKCAALPTAPQVDGMIFVSWNTDNTWWNVTEDMVVSPIYIYAESASMPQTNYGLEYAGEDIELTLSSDEDTSIYFTLDGSEPDVMSEEYTEPIALTDESVTVRAIAVAPKKNNSPVMNFVYTAQSEFAFEDGGNRTKLGEVEIDAVDHQTITLAVRAEELPALSSFRVAIDCDRDVFIPESDESGAYLVDAGDAIRGSATRAGGKSSDEDLICEPTDTGWNVFWNGEHATAEDGTLFTLTLKTAEDFEPGNYSLTAYLCQDYTLDEDGAPADVAADCLTFTDEINTCEEHAYSVMSDTATCLEGGTATYICYRCGETYTAASEARGHDYIAQSTTATCTEAGKTAYACALCGAEKTEDTPALGHDFIAQSTTATCTEDGELSYQCSRCEATKTEAMPATGHNYTAADSKAPTCTEDGFCSYVCENCGDTYAEIFEAAHLYELTAETEETCTADGSLTYTCSVCGNVSTVTVSALGHELETVPGKAATCTENGLTDGERCLRCGETLIAQTEITAPGHSYDEAMTDSTCKTEGIRVFTCAVCSDTYSEVIAKAHRYKDGKCKTCGLPEVHSGTVGEACTWQIVSDDYDSVVLEIAGTMPDFPSAKDVPWNEAASLITAVTITDGTVIGNYALYNCTRLQSVFAEDGISSVGKNAFYHDTALTQITLKNANLVGQNAFNGCKMLERVTFENDGYDGALSIDASAFRNCTALSEVTLPERGAVTLGTLSFANCGNLVEVILPASVISIGFSAFDCSALDGSGLTDIYIYNASCEIEEDEYALGDCGQTTIHCLKGSTAEQYAQAYKYNVVIECVTHSYEITGSREASCTQTAQTYYTCSVCDKKRTEETAPMLPHTETPLAAVKPTCTEAGLTEGSYCPVCNTVLIAQETIPAPGHNYDEGEITKPATCSETGEKTFTCTVCTAKKIEILPMNPHFAVTDAEVTASCTRTGLTEGSHCAICGTVLTAQEEIPLQEHIPETDEAVNPTCTLTGLTEGSHCAICGEILAAQEEIRANGHTLLITEGEEATCTENGATWGAYCTTCQKTVVYQKTLAILPHTETAAVTENNVPATCTADGSFDSVVYCESCERELSRETKVLKALGHSYTIQPETAPTCMAPGSSASVVCTRCKDILIPAAEGAPALGHSYLYVNNGDGTHTVSCARCEDGRIEEHTFTEGICVCGLTTEGDIVVPDEPVSDPCADGHSYMNGICAVCGAAENGTEDTKLKILSASLHLDEDIDVTYAVTVPDGYENPRMVFFGSTGSVTVTDFTEEDGKLHFTYEGITPQRMGDNIHATLLAEKDGALCYRAYTNYSVRQYCVNMLKKTNDEKLITLLSDLLTYGAVAQLYTGYKTNALVTDGLALTPSIFKALSDLAPFFTGTADEDTFWQSAGLTLSDSVAMRLTFCAATVDDLTVKVTVNGREELFTAKDFASVDGKENTYQITFRGINATEFADAVTATFERSGDQIGNTLSYSVNTYICAKQSNADTKLADLVKALFNYGASAAAYAES